MDNEQTFRLTQQGYELIWNWMRMNAQLCEVGHGGDCEDMNHEVAFMLAFVLPTPEDADALGIFDA